MSETGADVQFILDEIRKSGPVMIILGVVLVLGAIGGVFIPVEASAEAWVPIAKFAGLAALAALGVIVVIVGRKPPEKHAAIVLLTQTPDRIVWAHVMQVRSNGVHSATLLILHTDAGKTLEAPVPRTEAGEQRALALVRAVAPRATVGFRPELEAQFKKDPSSLRQAS